MKSSKPDHAATTSIIRGALLWTHCTSDVFAVWRRMLGRVLLSVFQAHKRQFRLIGGLSPTPRRNESGSSPDCPLEGSSERGTCASALHSRDRTNAFGHWTRRPALHLEFGTWRGIRMNLGAAIDAQRIPDTGDHEQQ
jgi:hypothetical protein